MKKFYFFLLLFVLPIICPGIVLSQSSGSSGQRVPKEILLEPCGYECLLQAVKYDPFANPEFCAFCRFMYHDNSLLESGNLRLNLKSSSIFVSQLDSAYFEFFSEDFDTWYVAMKRINLYYPDGRDSAQYVFSGDTDGTIHYATMVFVYDNDLRYRGVNTYRVEEGNSDQLVASIEINYGTNGLISQRTYYWFLEGGEKVPSMKEEYFYNSEGNLISHQTCIYDEDDQNFFCVRLNEFIYDEQGVKVEEHISLRVFESTVWELTGKVEFLYDNGNLTSDVRYMINRDSGNWELRSKNEYFYNASGWPDGEFSYYINDSGDGWENDYKIDDFVYDEHGNLLSMSGFYWDDIEIDWIEDLREYYYYTVTDISSSPVVLPGFDKLSVFPNPAFDYISFEGSTLRMDSLIEFYDINGRLAYKNLVSAEGKVNISTMRSGIYIYRVVSDGATYSGKFIKQ